MYGYPEGLKAFLRERGAMMVYLKFVEETKDGDVAYDYMPEKKTVIPGRVAMNRNTGERKLIILSPADDWVEYRGKAWKQIERMIASGNLIEETYNAWY